MSTFDIITKVTEVLMKVAALEARIDDSIKMATKVEDKLDRILERITTLEIEQKSLRNNLKTEIYSDIKSEIAVMQERFKYLEMNGKFLDTDGKN